MAQTTKTPAKADKAKAKADKPKADKKQQPKDDAQAVLERMKQKEADNPDSCIFC